jgi:hypothetical protein
MQHIHSQRYWEIWTAICIHSQLVLCLIPHLIKWLVVWAHNAERNRGVPEPHFTGFRNPERNRNAEFRSGRIPESGILWVCNNHFFHDHIITYVAQLLLFVSYVFNAKQCVNECSMWKNCFTGILLTGFRNPERNRNAEFRPDSGTNRNSGTPLERKRQDTLQTINQFKHWLN